MKLHEWASLLKDRDMLIRLEDAIEKKTIDVCSVLEALAFYGQTIVDSIEITDHCNCAEPYQMTVSVKWRA